MADKTFGVKVSDELNEKVRNMIEASGDSAKEWFEKAVALAEINSIKQGATDYKQDLTELEVHTARIYELVSNMVQRSIYLKDEAIRELTEKLDQREVVIGEYQAKAKAAEEAHKVSVEHLNEATQEKEEQAKAIRELQSTNDNNKALIGEYKEKIDTLSGLVSKYQGYAEENSLLKEQFAQEKERLQSQLTAVISQNDDRQDTIMRLTSELQSTKAAHEAEVARLEEKSADFLDRLNEKKDFEKERALLALERDYQSKMAKAREEHHAKIESMYEEINELRKALQSQPNKKDN
ncbi:chromosome segregation ATPase [Neobacillus niacini]|uniref:hypothetical protein n=1 Tax=Neobacillus niacini TaxID=86668 RepID=UPI00277DE48E|nr:hypothetical protein [Neobacillus niacini]MDQ1005389.1 chromosome segregation ATPase [Neobacillus niacini]